MPNNLAEAINPGAVPEGSVGLAANVVQAFKNDIQSTTSTSYVDITGLSAVITPSSINSKILVEVNIGACSSTTGEVVPINIQRDSGGGFTTVVSHDDGTGSGATDANDAFAAGGGHVTDTSRHNAPRILRYIDSPNTTNPITYKSQFLQNVSGTAYINRWALNTDKGAVSSITLTEIIPTEVIESSGENIFIEEILSSPGTFNIDVSSLGGKDLEVLVEVKSDRVDTDDGILMRFNNDNGSNYAFLEHAIDGAGSNLGTTNSANATSMLVGRCTGTTATTNAFGEAVVDIINYLSTDRIKQVECNGGTWRDSALSDLWKIDAAGWWDDTSKITSIQILPQVGSNFLAGSRVIVRKKADVEGGSSSGDGSIGLNVIRLNDANGYGATNTKILRWNNIEINDGGDALTLTQDSNDGDSITVNKKGWIIASLGMDSVAGDSWSGVSINSSELTTNIQSITAADRLFSQAQDELNIIIGTSIPRKVNPGDIIRGHTDGKAEGNAGDNTYFQVFWIADTAIGGGSSATIETKTEIDSITVASNGDQVSFSGINQGYDKLIIEISNGRADNTAINEVNMTYNGSPTYHSQAIVGDNSSADTQESAVGRLFYLSRDTEQPSIVTIEIPNYTSSEIKSAICVWCAANSSTELRVGMWSHRANLLVPITNIDLTCVTAGWQAGSIVKLYGIREESIGGSGTNYSTSEQDTGEKWVDGSIVYQKTIDVGALPNNGDVDTAHGITNMDILISAIGGAKESGVDWIPLPYPRTSSDNSVQVIVDGTNVKTRTSANFSAKSGFVTLKYTKT